MGKSNSISIHSFRTMHLRKIGEEGLRLVAVRRAGSGVADVANAIVTRQLGQIILVEHSSNNEKE